MDILKIFLELLLKLPGVWQRSNRDYYMDFIKGFEVSFERLHKDYVDSFSKYRNLFMEIEFPVDYESEIVKVIQSDSLFTEHIRAALYPISSHKKNKQIGPLISAISTYLNCASNSPEKVLTFKSLDIDFVSRYNMAQSIRPKVIDILLAEKNWNEVKKGRKEEAENSEIYRVQAIDELDQLFRHIQINYANVIKSFDDVKRDLLISKIKV
jgi:hypothetical protein